MQMIGRILRPFQGKESAIIFDHVGNLLAHQEPEFPGVPLHYLDHINWNFTGNQKRERTKTDERLTTLRLCPNCYMYFEGQTCPNCGTLNIKQREELKKVEAELIEIVPVPIRERPPEEKKEIVERIARNREKCEIVIDGGALGDMLAMSKELGYPPMWVYHELNKPRHSVNVSLLAEIARIQKYSPGWVWIQREKLKKR
jgi:hypothetical protein